MNSLTSWGPWQAAAIFAAHSGRRRGPPWRRHRPRIGGPIDSPHVDATSVELDSLAAARIDRTAVDL